MDLEREEKTKRLVEEAECPTNVGRVARELDIAWATARSTLLGLAVEEEISARRTENGWIFYTGEDD